MRTHTVIDGNAFYEVDDDCVRRLEQIGAEMRGDKNSLTARRNECSSCGKRNRPDYRAGSRK